LQLKNLHMYCSNLICSTRTELPSNMPNLETLSIGSYYHVYTIPKTLVVVD
jgi:hypothetical protein